MLALDDVHVRYRAVDALDGVSLHVARGETVALIGPSGGGKSTILRLLVGLESPTSGRVVVDGKDPCGPEGRALQQRIGYVIQEGGLFPHLSAHDNVALVARHLAWSASHIDARVDALAELVQLDRATLARNPRELSGGQRQRVALMRALMLDPELLLLDEPLGALDPIVRAELQDALASIFASLKKTVVVVTHDLVEATLLAPKLVVVAAGRVVAEGTLAQLRASSDAFVARFISAYRTVPA